MEYSIFYTKDKEKANKFLVDNLGEEYNNTFGVPMLKDSEEVFVCSWVLQSHEEGIAGLGVLQGLYNQCDKGDLSFTSNNMV